MTKARGGIATAQLRIVVAAMYVLALLVLPAAHRAPSFGVAPDLTSFALPDGSLPPLCINGKPGEGSPGSDATRPCSACILTAAHGPAPVNEAMGRRTRHLEVAIDWQRPAQFPPAVRRDGEARPRAPPYPAV